MLKVNINGQELAGFKGQTILDIARKNNIEIPTLCYDERLRIYGACGLCMVEIEGSSKLHRACATEISQGMNILTDTPRIHASRQLTLELLLSDHIGDCKSPCSNACPAEIDVQGYVGLIANRKYKEAVEVLKKKLPIPASIGRVCPHPCEKACRRQLVEEPVSIANLKYFAADLDINSDRPYIPQLKPFTGKEVAVIGAGPAGLSAAYHLAIEGHKVTVYDAMSHAGGMLRYGIPEYRLPKNILQKEIELIEMMGVKFIFNTKIGVDVSLENIRKDYDAVFLGIGSWKSSPLNCPGEDLPGVIHGIDFLREVAIKGYAPIGEKVAVIGGGNTAMDAARTAIRLGAKHVMVLYRRTRAEMPAEAIETIEAEEEGIEFRFLVAPLEINALDGHVESVRMQLMELGEPDNSGRRSPVPVPGAEKVIQIDTIIAAIGQKVDPEGLDGVIIGKHGNIEADANNFTTKLPGLFAGGDGVTGPKIAVNAIAQGKKAADAITHYLNGIPITFHENYRVEQKGLTEEDFADYEEIPRAGMPHIPPAERRDNFREVYLGLSEDDAVTEANRCLECGCRDFYECKLIRYANQYNVRPERIEGSKREDKIKEKNMFIERNSEKCILCGLCLRMCDEVMGVTALGLVNRGFESVIQPEFNLSLDETDCIGCGQCAAICPTGALTENLALQKNVPLVMQESESICPFCSVGCKQVINTCGETMVRALPAYDEILCRKGRFAFEAYNYERLSQPLVRHNGILVKTGWREAFEEIAKSIQQIAAQDNNFSSAVFISPSYSLEETDAAVEFGQKCLNTDKLSSFTPNLIPGISKLMGKTGRFDNLVSTDLILMAGSFNGSEVIPVKIRKAVNAGAKLIIIADEPTLVDSLAEFKINPSNGIDYIKQVQSAMIKKGLAAESYIKETKEFERIKTVLSQIQTNNETEKLAEVYGQSNTCVIIIDGNTVNTVGIKAITDLAMMRGPIDCEKNGLIVITPGSNQTGLCMLGAVADVNASIKSVKNGQLKCIFIMGEDPVGAGVFDPVDLSKVELKVILTPFITATAELADVVLPGSIPMESGGTFISADGSARKMDRLINPAAEFNNLAIIKQIAAAMQINLDGTRRNTGMEHNNVDFGRPDSEPFFTRIPVCDPALIKFRKKLDLKY